MQLTSYETASEMMQSLSAQIASELSAAIALSGRACLAVPGGSTGGLRPEWPDRCRARRLWR